MGPLIIRRETARQNRCDTKLIISMDAPMFKNLAIAATALVLITSATPSFSQSIEIGPGGVRVNPGMEPPPVDMGISERQAIRIARDEGVREVDDVARRRNVFIVEGSDRDGDDIKVVIDRRTGEVLSVE